MREIDENKVENKGVDDHLKIGVNKQRNWCQQTAGPVRQTKPSVCVAAPKKPLLHFYPFLLLCFTLSRVRPVGQILQNFGWLLWDGDGRRLSWKREPIKF